jgi:nicotinamidase-related amidase
MKQLIVIDMQKDFIDGALGNEGAKNAIPYVAEAIKNAERPVVFTRDTHYENYMETLEGKNLPVPHCIVGTPGH